jgi:hypothetical protein
MLSYGTAKSTASTNGEEIKCESFAARIPSKRDIQSITNCYDVQMPLVVDYAI